MIPTPPRILVARDPVDFRKGIAGLAAVSEVHLGEEPLDGTLFVFSSRDRIRITYCLQSSSHESSLPLAPAVRSGAPRGASPRVRPDRCDRGRAARR